MTTEIICNDETYLNSDIIDSDNIDNDSTATLSTTDTIIKLTPEEEKRKQLKQYNLNYYYEKRRVIICCEHCGSNITKAKLYKHIKTMKCTKARETLNKNINDEDNKNL
jgi:hypothetical protein